MYQVTGNPTYAANHLMLTNMLLHKDLDNDGGIPASADPASPIDASWVTNYLAMMGCDFYLGRTVDAGVVAMTSPRNFTGLHVGVSTPITALVGNWGTQALSNVMVTCAGAVTETLYVNLPVYQTISVTFTPWTPQSLGVDSLWVTVHAVGDTMTFNDTDISRFKVKAASSQLSAISLQLSPNPFNPTTAISYELRAASYVSLKVYDTTGRLVATLVEGWQEAGTHEATFDGSKLASGVYLYTLTAGGNTVTGKMVLLK
jgi:hypothetical protein